MCHNFACLAIFQVRLNDVNTEECVARPAGSHTDANLNPLKVTHTMCAQHWIVVFMIR